MLLSPVRKLALVLLFSIAAHPAFAQPQAMVDATMADALQVDTDMDGMADPGDTIRYTVEVRNPGATPADNAFLSVSPDLNTTIVGGSVSSTPIARNDFYSSIGNVGISLPPGSGVLVNDNDPDGGIVTVIPAAGGTTAGGAFSILADGSFAYLSPPGFEGVDTFMYSVMDDEGQSDMATISVTVNEVIWFVDPTAPPGGNGTLSNPFNDLAVTPSSFNVNAADDPGDIIFVADGAVTGGLSLQAGQQLIGDGSTSTLAAVTGIVVPPYSNALPAFSGTKPQISTSGAIPLILSSNNSVRGVRIGNLATTNSAIQDGGGSVGMLNISETSISGHNGSGIEIANGGTLAVSFDELSALNATSNEGINLVNVNGSFAVASGSVSASINSAVNVVGNPSVALNVTLTSVNANGFGLPVNGIRLQNTTGSFTVTGSGGVCTTATPNCSGGWINNIGGADGGVAGNGVYLKNATNVSLNLMRISDNSNHAIRGDTVTGFHLTDSLIDGTNGDFGIEGSIFFENLLGSANITGCDISGAFYENILIANSTGVLDRLNLTNCIIRGAAVDLYADSNAVLNVTANNNTFIDSKTYSFYSSSLGTVTMDVVVTNNTFQHNMVPTTQSDVDLAALGTSVLTYDVSNNNFQNTDASSIITSSRDASSVQGFINNNDIGTSGVPDSGPDIDGISVLAYQTSGHITQVTNNEIYQFGGNGIEVQAALGSATLNATVEGNTIAAPRAVVVEGFRVRSGFPGGGGDTNLVCLNAVNNIITGAGGGGFDFTLEQNAFATLNLPGYPGAATDTAAVVAYFAGNNPVAPTGAAAAAGLPGFTGDGVSCITPMPPPPAPVAAVDEASSPEQQNELLTVAAEVDEQATAMFHGATAETREFSVAGAAPGGSDSPTVVPTVDLALGNLDAGQVVVITFDVVVNNPFPPEVTLVCAQGQVSGENFAAVLTTDPDLGGVEEPTCTPIDQPEADLSISKFGDVNPAFAGGQLTYTVIVNNDGPDAASNVVVTDTLPAGVTFVSTSGCAEDPSGVPTCSLGTIADEDSAMYTITVDVDIDTEGTIVNTASVTSDTEDPEPDDNETSEETLVLIGADLSITKSDNIDPAVAGAQLTYTLTVDNAGPADAENVVVTDNLPDGINLVSTMGCAEDPVAVPTCSLGTISSGGTAIVTITVELDPGLAEGAVLTNMASVATSTNDPDPNNNATSEDTLVTREVDIEVTSMESIDPVVAGSGLDNLVHTVTFINNGPSDASGVVLSGETTAPVGVSCMVGLVLGIDGAEGTSSIEETEGGTVCNWSIGPIVLPALAGGSATMTMTVASNAPSGTNTILSTAQVDAVNETDTSPGNDSTTIATSIERQIDLTVTKSDDPDPVVAGLELNGLEYVVTVTNNGPSDGDAVVINDPASQFPVGVVLESHVASAGTYDGTDWLVDLPFGASEMLTMTLTVGPATVPGDDAIVNTAMVTGSGGNEVIINTGDDSATETTTVLPTTATWTITKDFLDDNASSITATLTCTSGEVTGPVQVSEGNPGELTVERFLMGPFGTTTCEVTESNLPPEYFQVSASEDCEVEGVVHEDAFGCDFVNAPIQANFVVTKDFSDDNPADVRVVLECNTGLPLMQEGMISEFGPGFTQIVFIVKDFEIGTLDCDVFEEPIPVGYEESYAADVDPIDALYGDFGADDDGCYFLDIETGTYYCDITDTLLPVDVTVNKEWIDEHPEYQLPTYVEVELECNAPILYGCGATEGGCGIDSPGSEPYTVEEYIDPNNPLTVQVLPHWDGTTVCSATETPEAGVVIDESDCEAIPLAPGQGGECTIVNTRLFAGIPTLSEWGLMIMALMMLGIGMVAYRRFV